MVPIFLWIAFRLGTRGVSLSNLMLSIAAVWGPSNGLGAFSGRITKRLACSAASVSRDKRRDVFVSGRYG
jgi:hypothetical protein